MGAVSGRCRWWYSLKSMSPITQVAEKARSRAHLGKDGEVKKAATRPEAWFPMEKGARGRRLDIESPSGRRRSRRSSQTLPPLSAPRTLVPGPV